MKQLFNDAKAKKNPMGDDTKYSRAIKVPQYTPSDEKPVLESIYDLSKYSKLMARINKSSVSEEEKTFLKFAASRHIKFTYSKIADYYAHASKEMQELMEESALVILDMDDAIANGYVQLSEKMRQLIEEEKERDAQAKESANVLKQQRELAEQKAREEAEAKKEANRKKKKKQSNEESPEGDIDGAMNEPVEEKSDEQN